MAADRQIPSIYDASALWNAIGVFALVLGLFLLVFDGPVFSFVEWLVEDSHSGPNPLTPKTAEFVEKGIDTWVWAGLAVAAVSFTLGNGRFKARLASLLRPIVARQDNDSLPPNRQDWKFLLAALAVLAFAVLSHSVLMTHLDTDWLEGEGGISEWWSVATYLVASGLAGAAAWALWATRHTKLRYFYMVIAVVFFLGAMEEISWGQRLVGWGTPEAFSEINFQDETTIHNVNFANNVIFEVLFWGSALGMVGGLWRLTANLRGLNDRMRLFLPSLTMAPALLMIMVWRTGELWQTANIPRLVMDHFNSGPRGSEVPEVMLGLCIVMYTFTNMKQARHISRSQQAKNLDLAKERA
jgi:hypothetical protein